MHTYIHTYIHDLRDFDVSKISKNQNYSVKNYLSKMLKEFAVNKIKLKMCVKLMNKIKYYGR